MIDYHDDASASYYEYSDDACTPANRVTFKGMYAGECNAHVDSAFGNAANIPMMWKWASTRLSLATGVKGPVVEVYNANHFCGYTRPTYYIEYPATPKESCILNLTHALVDPANPTARLAQPVPLHYRHYFTAVCMEDKISVKIQHFHNQGGNADTWRQGVNFVEPGTGGLTDFRAVQHGHPKRCLQSPNITRYITQACMTDGRDSWRAGLFGCGYVTPSSDASGRL